MTGASSGIGRELARCAARDHDAVLLVARSADALAELAGELDPEMAEAAWLCADLAAPDAGDRIEAALFERGWHCEILIAAAGLGHVGPAWRIDRTDQLAIVDVNVRAVTDLAVRFLAGMTARGSGGLLFVGSVSGFVPGPNMAVYFASKAYIHSLSMALRAEARSRGVNVTCLAPGFVKTPFLEASGLRPTRLRKLLPSISAADAASIGWRGFKAGRAVVVPHLTAKTVAAIAPLLPTGLVTRLIGRLQKPTE